MNDVDHALNSVLREVILEHLFIGEVLRLSWRRGVTDIEVLRSESDSFGYDLVMSRGAIVRHIQLKARLLGGKAKSAKAALALIDKPSACLIWMVVTKDLSFDHFLWFGEAPGQRIKDISDFKVARHNKGDATGHKAERQAHRLVPRREFTKLDALDAVVERLFGPMP